MTTAALPRELSPPASGRAGRARRVLAAVALGIGLVVAAWPLVSDFLDRPVQSVRIAGDLTHVPRAELERVIEPFLAAGFARIDVDGVRKAVGRIPWVRQASVRRVWPGSLHVAIVERAPVARWNDRSLLEADATVFTPGTLPHEPDLPSLAGPDGSEIRVLDRYVRFAGAAAAIGDSVSGVTLSALGDWTVRMKSGLTLVFDSRDDVEAVDRYVRAFPRLFGDRMRDVERVDFRYTNGFAVRWRHAQGAAGGPAS